MVCDGCGRTQYGKVRTAVRQPTHVRQNRKRMKLEKHLDKPTNPMLNYCGFSLPLFWNWENPIRTYEKKRYAHQVFGNVGNFQIAYSDGIVVLTL